MPVLFTASLLVLGLSDVAWGLEATPLWAVGWALAFLATRAYRGTSHRRQVVSTKLALTHAPYVLIIPAAITFASQWHSASTHGPQLAAGVLMVVLLLLRQHVTLLENRGLVKRLAETESLLRYRATHDDLTGLAGRALLLQRLQEIAQQGGDDRWPVSLVFIDLDGFKGVNDAHGHAGGDDLLVTLAQRLGKVTEPMGTSALAVRISGDEFAVLLTDEAATDAVRIAEDILEQNRATDRCEWQSSEDGASVGVASTTQGALSASELLAVADDAMYRVKTKWQGRRGDGSGLANPSASRYGPRQPGGDRQALRWHRAEWHGCWALKTRAGYCGATLTRKGTRWTSAT